MSKKLRVIVAVVMVELLLGGLWFYLGVERATQGGEGSADALATISGTMGTAMGAFLGLGLLLLFAAATNGRSARDGKR